MKWLRFALNLYLEASVHVAFSVLALTLVTGFIFDFKVEKHLLYFVFFGTMACYNFVKYGVEAKKYLLITSFRHKSIQVFSLVAFGIALYQVVFFSAKVLGIIGVILLLTVLYALPVLPNAKNLRSLGVLKIFLIGTVWTLSTVFLPVVLKDTILSWDIFIEAFQRFLLVLILLVPFEIRDLRYDPPHLGTLPQRIGSTNTKSLGAIGAMIFFFITFLKDEVATFEATSKGMLFLILGFTMFLTRRNQGKYFASFWVDGIPILWWGILWMWIQFLPN